MIWGSWKRWSEKTEREKEREKGEIEAPLFLKRVGKILVKI